MLDGLFTTLNSSIDAVGSHFRYHRFAPIVIIKPVPVFPYFPFKY